MWYMVTFKKFFESLPGLGKTVISTIWVKISIIYFYDKKTMFSK